MAYFRCGASQAAKEPYIYNTHHGTFNTMYIHKANTKIKCKVACPNSSTYSVVFGARNGNYQSHAFGFFNCFNGWRACLYRTGSETSSPFFDNTLQQSMIYTRPVIIEATGNTATVTAEDNPSEVLTITASGTVDDGVSPLAIFATNNASSSSGYSPVDYGIGILLYWFEIYEDDVLKYRFIPAQDQTEYCLYDEVSGTYLHADSGNYICGVNVERRRT